MQRPPGPTPPRTMPARRTPNGAAAAALGDCEPGRQAVRVGYALAGGRGQRARGRRDSRRTGAMAGTSGSMMAKDARGV